MSKKIWQNNYIATFGIEIHAELLTNTKAFSPAKSTTGSMPNINVNQIDIGYPGAKPTVNKKMVNFAYRICKALDMEIDTLLRFDRKNYFYPDLPKGFQITQFNFPIGKNGKLTIVKDNGETKDISIRQLHMEEDTAKQIKKGKDILFDFNRSGIPLVEIVSNHGDFDGIEDVILYVKQLREQLMFLNVNDGKLFEGSFRVDVNVSVAKKDAKELGTRVEIKNLNSFNNIKEALEFEINYQIDEIEKGNKIEEITKRFDEVTKKTIKMRKKDSFLEYNFIPEGNIIPIKLTQQTITSFDSYPVFKTSQLRKKLIDEKIELSHIDIFMEHSNLMKTFRNFSMDFPVKKVSSFLTMIFYPILLEQKINIFKYVIPEVKLGKIAWLLFENKITNSEAKKIIEKLINDENITEELDFFANRKQASSDDLVEMINKIIDSNIELMKEYKTRPERVSKFIMGQLMKETKGSLNAKLANEKIQEMLKKYE